MSGKIHNTSYAAFKQKARQHQVMFRETELGVGYHEYPNVLKAEDAKKGLIFCELYREEIIEELKKLGREDILITAGGVIPAQDYDYLYKAGVAAIFGPGTPVAKSAATVLEILLDE